MKESELMKQILEYLKYIGGRYLRINTGSTKIGGRYFRSAPKGTLDIVGFDDRGYFIAIEVKESTGKLSPEQEDFMESVKLSLNGIYIIARSIEDVMCVLY